METSPQDPSLYEFMIKLLIIGDTQTGKSSLVSRFCNNTFAASYVPTTGVNFKYKMLDFNAKKVKVQVWDTAGSDYSNSLLKIYYKKAMGIMLLFSLEDPKSLENISTWMQHIQASANQNAIVILVGNKSDSSKKAVQAQDIKAIQNKYKISKYFETSVQEGLNVNETFTELVKEVKEKIDAGLFKVEESPITANATPEKKLTTNILGSLTLKNKEQVKTVPVANDVEEKDQSNVNKISNEAIEKKLVTMIESAKKEMSYEIEEIRQTTRQELEIKLIEEVNKLRKEFIQTPSKNNKVAEHGSIERQLETQDKQKEENLQALKGEIRWLTKAFEDLRSSISEDIVQAKLKTDKSLDKYAKENIIFEERLIHLENQMKRLDNNTRNSPRETDSKLNEETNGRRDSNQAPQNTSGTSDNNVLEREEPSLGKGAQVKVLNLDVKKQESYRYLATESTDPNFDDYNVSITRYEQADAEKTWKYESSKHRLSEHTSPTQFSSNYYGQDTYKTQEPNERHQESIVETSLLDVNTNQDDVLKQMDSKYPSYPPKALSLGNVDDGLTRTVIDLQHSVALIEEETNKLHKKMLSIETKKAATTSRQKSARLPRRGSQVNKRASISKAPTVVNNEITSLWETINTLVKNTHEEIDKMKAEVQVFRPRGPADLASIPEALIEKCLYGVVGDLRDDVHNQLIEIQRELEGSYATFRTSLLGSYEDFFAHFQQEQAKLKIFMEERCQDVVEEALRKVQTKIVRNTATPDKRCFSATTSPEPRSRREDTVEVQLNTTEIMIDRRKRSSFQTKINSLESQQRQLLSSYSDSFKGMWETVHMLTDKINKLEEKESCIGTSRTTVEVLSNVGYKKPSNV